MLVIKSIHRACDLVNYNNREYLVCHCFSLIWPVERAVALV